jgi:hypothetical protein
LRQLLVQHFQTSKPPAGFDRHPIVALNSFERAAHRNGLAPGRFQVGAGLEIGLRFIGPA